ncbi:MAG: molybdopterin-dependent oxidoreductase, partial [Lentilitoribacter sp.]
MTVYKYPTPLSSEITPKEVFLNRRSFIKAAGVASATAMTSGLALQSTQATAASMQFSKSKYSITDEPNPIEDIKGYNNFYEFGTGKGDPSANAGSLTTRPWSIKIDGLTNKPGELDIEDLMSKFDMEERIYRLRCVEAWSMVIPWVGIPLRDVINAYEPQGSAKYVSFETLV